LVLRGALQPRLGQQHSAHGFQLDVARGADSLLPFEGLYWRRLSCTPPPQSFFDAFPERKQPQVWAEAAWWNPEW
jgi:hypothetical protein